MRNTGLASFIALVISAGAAFSADSERSVDPYYGFVGHMGVSAGANYTYEVDTSPLADDGTLGFGQIDGSLGYKGGAWMLGAEAAVRYDDFQSTDSLDGFRDYENPEWQGNVTGHFLFDLSASTRIGAFSQYGDTLPQDGDKDDAYDYYLVGLEAQTFLADNVLVFGQAGIGDKIRDGEDENEGFVNGFVLRSGIAYFATDATTLIADAEFASSKDYIDDNDPGRHFGFAISGETLMSEGMPLYLTYGGTYTHINSTDESEQVDEWTAMVGLDLVFGAVAPKERWTNGMAIGAPRLPVRASAWTEWAD